MNITEFILNAFSETFEFTFLPRFFEITPEFQMDEIHQYAQERGKEYQLSVRRQANWF